MRCKCYYTEGGKGLCYGTKERDPCDCGGDESLCDYYPAKRNRCKDPEQYLQQITDIDLRIRSLEGEFDDAEEECDEEYRLELQRRILQALHAPHGALRQRQELGAGRRGHRQPKRQARPGRYARAGDKALPKRKFRII